MAGRGRHGARRLLLQALYQNQIARHSAEELVDQFSTSHGFSNVDGDYFLAMLTEILNDTGVLDGLIAAAADRPVEQLDPVERSVLWIGLTELKLNCDVPTKVVIDEAVELTKEFGAQDSYRYVNAILDAAAAELR